MVVPNRNHLVEGSILGFHVSFRGCTSNKQIQENNDFNVGRVFVGIFHYGVCWDRGASNYPRRFIPKTTNDQWSLEVNLTFYTGFTFPRSPKKVIKRSIAFKLPLNKYPFLKKMLRDSWKLLWIPNPIGSMWLVYLPTFTIQINVSRR